MQTLKIVNYVVAILFMVCYFYQYIFIPLAWFMKKKKKETQVTLHDFAVLICARNESAVIADLIGSVKNQTYPSDKVTVFVMADNCTDNTAEIAREAGAVVYERFDKVNVGKGYALEVLLKNIKEDFVNGFDGYFVFDADNILSADYIEQMNKTFCEGNEIITSYRNTKNYGSNWISSGYALWFLRESKYLNYVRDMLGTSCAVSGTGFMFSRKVAEEINGWPFHLLTEDIEFSIYQVTKGRRIAFCKDAEFFDEQPVSFKQSWRQRRRWAKGYFQVFERYGGALVKGTLKGKFACFDMSMTIMPAFFLSLISIVSSIALGIWGAAIGDDVRIALKSVGETFGGAYIVLFAVGLITTISEWKHIHAENWKKILFTLTFPVFMLTYMPIAYSAMFGKTTWKPIVHTYSSKNISATDLAQMSKAKKIA